MTGEAAHPLVRWARRHSDRLAVALLAVVAYVPIVLTGVGRVSADTKTYLTIDPGNVVRTAPSMWDPSVGAGTVPHQNIGYLFPLGPYYWVMEAIGSPDWLTQRLLWGTLVFAAAYGTYRLLRWLGWVAVAAFVAAFAYGLSPYLLSYLARLSAILGPWAAMPWMILLAAKAARTSSWRPAAWFAVVIALVGSVNATALVFAGLGPVLWLGADVVAGRVRFAEALRGALKIGALSVLVSAWWIAGLRVQGVYGIPILQYTESYEAVASASTPAEVLRGLGYWFFYGGDGLDPWVGPSTPYLDNPFVMTLGFLLGGLALLGLLTRFAGRATAALLLFVGLAVCVGAAPLGDSTLYGTVFERFARDSTIGLALRSTTRAAPLVVLALAMGLGAGTQWVRRVIAERRALGSVRGAAGGPRATVLGLVPPLGVIALLAVQMFPWFTGTVLTPSIERDEELPGYRTELAAWLDATGEGRVYELPGSDFANHRWGGTVDPVLPGMIDRPYLARELVPQGGDATADLLNAFERRLADGWFEPEALRPTARLFDVATIVTRNDLEHERYRLARPGPLWTDVTSVLGQPDHAGPLVADDPQIRFVDSLTLARPDEAEEFPVVAAFDLGEAPGVGSLPTEAPLIVAGSGDGLVDLAAAGLLDPERPILYAATLDDLVTSGERSSDDVDAMVGTDPWWIVTDTNRKQGRHWSTISSNLGALEAEGALSLDDDPGDNRLAVFDDALANQTIAVHTADVADVRASYYGNAIAYTPEDAPWFAIDGDPSTAWRAGVFEPTTGLVWEADLAVPANADAITVLQPVTGAVGRYITRLAVTVGGQRFEVPLDERSRAAPGQSIDLPVDTFDSIRLEVLADNVGRLTSYAGQPGVGFAEVVIPGIVDDRVVQVPDIGQNAAFDPAGTSDDRLTYVFSRERIDPATPNRTAPEPRLVRRFDVPGEIDFDLTGEARISAMAPDALIQDALGEQIAATADRRLHGNVGARGASALDGDPATAWTTPDGEVVGSALTFVHPAPSSRIVITWLDDDEHSSPTRFSLVQGSGVATVLDVGDAATRESAGGTSTAAFDVAIPAGSTSILTIEAIAEVTAPDYYSKVPVVLPVALVEVDVGTRVDGPSRIDTGCRSDFLTLDGEPLAARIVGQREDALARGELMLEACSTVELGPGSHRLDAASGAATGFDLDRLVLDSVIVATGGGDADAPESPAPPPSVEIDERSSTEIDVSTGPSEASTWLTLDQSWNPGWRATVDGTDLGTPVLINGYANGWILPAAVDERVVELRWTPQRSVRVGLVLSAIGALVVLGILALPRLRRRPVATPSSQSSSRSSQSSASGAPLWPRRSVIAAVAFAVVVLAVGGALAALAAVATMLLLPRWRWLPATVVLGLGGVVGAAIVLLEWHRDYPAAPFWPTQFAWAAPLVWVVVAVVGAAAVFPDGVGRAQTSPDVPDSARMGR